MEKKIILLADDDSDDSEMFCEALADIDDGIVCQCSINGVEALSTLTGLEQLPKLIFLDINMPLMNGWQCLELLKNDNRYSDVPVIMISTSSHRKDIDKAFTLGALGYLVKPNSFHELLKVLQAISENIEADLRTALRTLEEDGSAYIFVSE